MSPRQREFARHYAKTQNLYQSAREVGYSHHYANGLACRNLLKNPKVISEIKRVRERLNQVADKSSVDVVNEFSKIAFVDRVDFLKPDPLREDEFIYKSPDELTPDQRAIIEKVTWNNIEIVIIIGEGKDKEVQKHWRKEYNYVLADKSKALEQMGRHFGIFDDKLRIGVSQVNPFTNISSAQLAKLKETWINTMTDPKLIEGDFKEVKTNGS